MKTCGITAEYNPFHNGHAYHIKKSRELTGCDAVIAVMSGNFVQRGEPALIDKWKRAEAAIRGGADIVIELPFLSSVQSASVFAAKSVEYLKMAKADWISFGSECGNLENLQDIADTSVNPDHIKMLLDEGMSYPRAYSLLTRQMMPNDLLAVSYLKEMKNTGITPVIVQRTSEYLSEEMHPYASAAAVRKAVSKGADISHATPMAETINNSFCVFPEMFYPYLRTLLLTETRQQLQRYFLNAEGIEKVLTENAMHESSWEGFLNACTSYRYTASRIRRTCLQIMCHVTRDEAGQIASEPAVLRILALNDTGRKWLKERKTEDPDFPAAARFAELPEHRREAEYRAAMLYASVLPEEQREQVIKKEIRGSLYITD